MPDGHLLSRPYPPLVSIAQAIADEAAFADYIDTLDHHPQGADCNTFVQRYNDVDLMCQRVLDDATPDQRRLVTAEMRRVRAAVIALERRHRAWAVNQDVEETLAGAATVTRVIMQHASRTS
jgi:hypothetical protein